MAMIWRQQAETVLVDLLLDPDGFTADDLTQRAGVPDGKHEANGANNAVGSFIRTVRARGWIETTGEVRRSTATHRKGGMQQVWRGTPAGRIYAERIKSP